MEVIIIYLSLKKSNSLVKIGESLYNIKDHPQGIQREKIDTWKIMRIRQVTESHQLNLNTGKQSKVFTILM